MNAHRFNNTFRSLTSGTAHSGSRRGLLTGLTSSLVATLPLSLASKDAAAKKKKKGRKKTKKSPPPTLNAFSCVDVGQACQGDSALCCSGICQGAPPRPGQVDTSVCVAHNAGICFADSDICSIGAAVACNPSKPNCACTATTGNAGFCADLNAIDKSCRFCSTDTDCQEEFGAGAACIVLKGICTAICGATGRTACARPCI